MSSKEQTLTDLWNELVDQVSERLNALPPIFEQDDVRMMCKAHFEAGIRFTEQPTHRLRTFRELAGLELDWVAGVTRLDFEYLNNVEEGKAKSSSASTHLAFSRLYKRSLKDIGEAIEADSS